MTKRQLKQIMSLYKSGISRKSAIRLTIDICFKDHLSIRNPMVDETTQAVMNIISAIEEHDSPALNGRN